MKANKNSSNRLAFTEGWLSIVVNFILFGLKYWAGIVTGSVAIIADAWHTLSDSITSVIVIVGTKASQKPADKEHPFGHGRAEIIAAVIIGVLVAVIGFEFVLESIQKLKGGEATQFGIIALIVTIVSILTKEAMAQFAFWAGRKTNSRSLKADGVHHRSDALSSIIILAGIFFGPYFWWMDGVLGLIVAALLFYAAYDILKDAISTLLGEEANEGLTQQIREISNKCCSNELNMHHFHLHHYGNHQELTFHIKLDGGMKLEEAHEIATKLENEIKNNLNITATIHMEPIEKTH